MNNKRCWGEATAITCMIVILILLALVLLFGKIIVTDHPIIITIEFIAVAIGFRLYIKNRRIRFTFHPKRKTI